MLKQLSVQNFALIDQIEIEFGDGLSVITGETGAGKSILIGALSLILGNRADHNSLNNKDEKCIIEGVFDISNYNLQSFFEVEELDYSIHTTLRREINPQGKSRNFINDTPTTLEVMRGLGNELIDIHSQHQSLKLNESAFQLEVIDAIANNSALLKNYQAIFKSYKIALKELLIIKNKVVEAKQQEDYLSFQLNELNVLAYKTGEQKLLEEEQEKFSNSELIIANLSQLINGLSQGEDNALDKITHLKQLLNQIVGYDADLNESLNRLNSLQIELKDLALEMENKAEDFQYDPERHQIVEERLSEIHRLQNKHHLGDAEDLLSIQEKLEMKLNELLDLDISSLKLEKQIQNSTSELTELANQLQLNRNSNIPTIEKNVETMLHKLGMPYARFKIEHSMIDDFNTNGLDHFEFLFSANKGMDPQSISKTASGGELSRLMLCIKSLVAEYKQMPTILFDEIDTGVSGEVAHQMGEILNQIGQQRQVIVITHLPQLAVKGKSHYFVFKKNDQEKSITEIKKLDDSERIEEIAKMLSGNILSEAARINAKELLSQ